MSNDRYLSNYVKPQRASSILGLATTTIKRMALDGTIRYIQTDKGRYLYDVSKFIGERNLPSSTRKKICYARVSSRAQKPDLQNQTNYLKTIYPEHEIITDYASGLNFNRKGLKTILDLAYKGELQEVVVTHKDRLCRFGFELIQYVLQSQSNAEIVVLGKYDTTPEYELSCDLLSIITVFSARMHGLRKYKNKIKEDPSLFLETISEKNEDDDRCIPLLL